MNFKYLFGPVPSRRLGLSLGIDLVPSKVCSLNCVYCESGKTTNLTNLRSGYIPVELIIEELNLFLAARRQLDYITFSGAGEPLLNNGIGKLIEYIKTNYPEYKLALITNSVSLTEKSVREDVKNIDLIMPSLDAATETAFCKLNRPAKGVNVKLIIDGLVEFRRISKAQMWLEVFIIEGINDTDEELTDLKKAIVLINPNRLQINTLDRPGTESWVNPASEIRLKEIAGFFHPVNTEIIAKKKQVINADNFNQPLSQQIIAAISRRPCTIEDLEIMTGLNRENIESTLDELKIQNIIIVDKKDRGDFFILRK